MAGTPIGPVGILAFGLLLLAGCAGDPSDKSIAVIPLTEVRALALQAAGNPRAVLLIDSRSQDAFGREHLVGAINLQLFELDPQRPRLRRFDGYGDLVVYGDDAGSTTARALTKRLMDQKYGPARWYRGGLSEWKGAGLPVEAGPAKPPNAK